MICIKYMTHEALEFIKQDIKKNEAKRINEKILNNPNDYSWLEEFTGVQCFEEIKCTIEEFALKYSDKTDNKEFDYENAIILYEHLNKLPRYILTEERFWAWLNFTVGYKYAVRRVPIQSKSTVGDHYLFNKGNRRGCFFGVLSRLYFYTDLTIEESLGDKKYDLTKFILEKEERIRNLTWRANSNEKHLVLSIVRAEKDVHDKYFLNDKDKNKYLNAERNIDNINIYTAIAKHISYYGSLRLIDAISEEDLYNEVVNFMEKFIAERNQK